MELITPKCYEKEFFKAGGGRVSALPLLPAGGRIKPKYYEEEIFGFSLGCSSGGVPHSPFDWSYLLPIFCLIFNLFFYVESKFYWHTWC